MLDTIAHARCQNCGAPFSPDRISAKARFAECNHCGALHNLSSLNPVKLARPPRITQLPDGIAFGENRRGATIRVRGVGTITIDRLAITFSKGLLARSKHDINALAGAAATPAGRSPWHTVKVGFLSGRRAQDLLESNVDETSAKALITLLNYCIARFQRDDPASHTKAAQLVQAAPIRRLRGRHHEPAARVELHPAVMPPEATGHGTIMPSMRRAH